MFYLFQFSLKIEYFLCEFNLAQLLYIYNYYKSYYRGLETVDMTSFRGKCYSQLGECYS